MATLHDHLVHLLRGDPSLLVALLHPHRPDLPPTGWTEVSESVGQAKPLQRHVDLVLKHPDFPLVLLVEIQNKRDPAKRRTWPSYTYSVADRYDCDVLLVIITLDRDVAAWAEEPLCSPCGIFTPFVLGPDNFPIRDDDPALLTLAALARGDRDPNLVRRSVSALATLDRGAAAAYFNLIRVRWPEIAKAILEELMDNVTVDTSAFDVFIAEYSFRRGEARGEAKGYQRGEAKGQAATQRDLAARLLVSLHRQEDLPRLAALPDADLPAFLDELMTLIHERTR